MPSLDLERAIAAEPTSTALLLSAPAAAELWPGATLVSHEPGDPTRVAMEGLDAPVLVRAVPPVRTPTAYVIRFTMVAPDGTTVDGELSLTHQPVDDEDRPATKARLVLRLPDGSGGGDDVTAALRAGAPAFLDNLAAAAEERSRAA